MPSPTLSTSYLRRTAFPGPTALGSVRWPSYLAVALGIVLFTSTIAMLPQVILFWQTGARSGLSAGLGLRILREVSWAATLLLFTWALFFGKIRPHGHRGALLAATCIGLCALSVVVWSTVVKDVNGLVQILGLRLLTYVPAVWVGYVLMKDSPERSMRVLDKALRLFLAVQFSISLVQNVVSAGALSNQRGLLGTRSFGTFSNVNQFSAAAVGAAALLLATSHVRSRRKTLFWLGVCFALAVMSGSRTGMVTTLFMLSYAWLEGIRIDPIVRILAYTVSPVLVLAAVVYFGSAGFTGRTAVNPLEDSRFVIWSWVEETISDPGEVLFGDGLGYGTSAYNILSDAGLIDATVVHRKFLSSPGEMLSGNTHSSYLTLLTNYGIGGLLLFGWLLVAVWKRAHRYRRVIVLGVLMVSIPKSMVESFPGTFLVYLAMGIVLAAPFIRQPSLWGRRDRTGERGGRPGSEAFQLGR